jgi:hypothetical protein
MEEEIKIIKETIDTLRGLKHPQIKGAIQHLENVLKEENERRETELKKREASVAHREERLNVLEADLNQKYDDLEKKMQEFKELQEAE